MSRALLQRVVVPGAAFLAGIICVILLHSHDTHRALQEGISTLYLKAKGKPVIEKTQTAHDVEVKWPTYPLPPVRTSLTTSGFAKDFKEDPRLSALRRFGVVENIPDARTLETYTLSQLSAIYHSYLDNVNIICHRKLRMGHVGDGGWEICDDIQWRPIRPCVIYSFGINYDFSFDDDAGRIYGCNVYSFDPSMKKMSTSRHSDRVMFYKLGIGGQSGEPEISPANWTLHSFSNFRQMLGHSRTIIDVLKMDVESAEWRALPTMLKERQLETVRQLLIEFHKGSDDTSLLPHLNILRGLEEIGFKRFYVSKNAVCRRKALDIPILRTSCYEIHFVNTKLARDVSS